MVHPSRQFQSVDFVRALQSGTGRKRIVSPFFVVIGTLSGNLYFATHSRFCFWVEVRSGGKLQSGIARKIDGQTPSDSRHDFVLLMLSGFARTGGAVVQ